jgi:hypothetical protein
MVGLTHRRSGKQRYPSGAKLRSRARCGQLQAQNRSWTQFTQRFGGNTH